MLAAKYKIGVRYFEHMLAAQEKIGDGGSGANSYICAGVLFSSIPINMDGCIYILSVLNAQQGVWDTTIGGR